MFGLCVCVGVWAVCGLLAVCVGLMCVCLGCECVWCVCVCVCFSLACPSGDDMMIKMLPAISAHLAFSPRMKLSFWVGLQVLNWGNIRLILG